MLSSTSSSDQHPATISSVGSTSSKGELSTLEVSVSDEPSLQAPSTAIPQSEWDDSEPVSPLISSGALSVQRTSPKAMEPVVPPRPKTRGAAWHQYAPDVIGWMTFVAFFVLPWLLLCGVSLRQLGIPQGILIALPLPLMALLGFELWFRLGNSTRQSPSPEFFVAIGSLLGLFLSFLLFSSFMP